MDKIALFWLFLIENGLDRVKQIINKRSKEAKEADSKKLEVSNQKKRRNVHEPDSTAKRTRSSIENSVDEELDYSDIEQLQKDNEEEGKDNEELNSLTEAEGEEVIKPAEFSANQEKGVSRSRSASPDRVDHRPKPISTPKSDKRIVKDRLKKATPKKKFKFAKSATPKRVKDKELESDSGSSEGEISDSNGGDSETSIEYKSSSSGDNFSTSDNDDRPYKRQKKSRSNRSRKRDRSTSRKRKRRRRSRSISRDKASRKGRTGKDRTHKLDVNQIVQEALDKQRVQMEEYFAKLQGGACPTPKGKTHQMPKLNLLKSPSDTTIYAPAVQLISEVGQPDTDKELRPKETVNVDGLLRSIRAGINISGDPEVPRDTTPEVDAGRPQVSTDDRDAIRAAETAVIQAEKFKAQLETPRGKFPNPQELSINLIDKIGKQTEVLDDDTFIQVSCHVEQPLYGQCERGEYVHLPKLKPKPHDKLPNEEDYAMELHHKDGRQYWAPANRDSKINGIRQWEQCFRVYAEIYSRANPTRAAEIWQYIETINQAASTFVWDNVALYDYHFRKNMERNPRRSWAKTFTQMWNVDLREHKMVGQVGQRGDKPSQSNKNVCWKYNKGNCPYGIHCRFDHRCSYCFGRSHTSQVCRRKKGNENGHGSQMPSQGQDNQGQHKKKNKPTTQTGARLDSL